MLAQDHYTEHLLCTVRIYNDGLVEMNPKLSSVIEEQNGQPKKDASDTLFMSDESVSAATRTGLRLGAYRVRSKLGSEYEYTLSQC